MIIDRKEEMKRIIAKTLLVVQLFSPMGIKFTTKSYKGLEKLCTKVVNDIVIDYNNPFNGKNCIIDRAFKESDEKDEIEELLSAVELNMNISSKDKKQVETIRVFLKDNPYINLNSLYSLLGKLEITDSSILGDSLVMQFSRGALEFKNKDYVFLSKIKINKELTEDYDSYTYDSVFFHELVHTTGSFATKTLTGEVGYALNEGMTSLIQYDYYQDENQSSYFFFRTCAKLLAEIIGEDNLLKYYSTRDLTGVIIELETKGIENEKSVKLIKNIDKFYDLIYEKKESVPFELVSEIIGFFGNYLSEIEKGPMCDYQVYMLLLNDMMCFLNDPSSIKSNSVTKFYYNSKAKEENKDPYYIKTSTSYDELEFLKNHANIEFLSPDFNDRYDQKEVKVKVYLDNTYGMERGQLEHQSVR